MSSVVQANVGAHKPRNRNKQQQDVTPPGTQMPMQNFGMQMPMQNPGTQMPIQNFGMQMPDMNQMLQFQQMMQMMQQQQMMQPQQMMMQPQQIMAKMATPVISPKKKEKSPPVENTETVQAAVMPIAPAKIVDASDKRTQNRLRQMPQPVDISLEVKSKQRKDVVDIDLSVLDDSEDEEGEDKKNLISVNKSHNMNRTVFLKDKQKILSIATHPMTYPVSSNKEIDDHLGRIREDGVMIPFYASQLIVAIRDPSDKDKFFLFDGHGSLENKSTPAYPSSYNDLLQTHVSEFFGDEDYSDVNIVYIYISNHAYFSPIPLSFLPEENTPITIAFVRGKLGANNCQICFNSEKVISDVNNEYDRYGWIKEHGPMVFLTQKGNIYEFMTPEMNSAKLVIGRNATIEELFCNMKLAVSHATKQADTNDTVNKSLMAVFNGRLPVVSDLITKFVKENKFDRVPAAKIAGNFIRFIFNEIDNSYFNTYADNLDLLSAQYEIGYITLKAYLTDLINANLTTTNGKKPRGTLTDQQKRAITTWSEKDTINSKNPRVYCLEQVGIRLVKFDNLDIGACINSICSGIPMKYIISLGNI